MCRNYKAFLYEVKHLFWVFWFEAVETVETVERGAAVDCVGVEIHNRTRFTQSISRRRNS